MALRQMDVLLSEGDLTKEVNIMLGGNVLPTYVIVTYECNANIDAETLDIYGQQFGASDYNTAVLVSQITQAAGAIVKVDLSTAARGCWRLKFVSGTLAATESTIVRVTVFD